MSTHFLRLSGDSQMGFSQTTIQLTANSPERRGEPETLGEAATGDPTIWGRLKWGKEGVEAFF